MQLIISDDSIHLCGELPIEQWAQFVKASDRLITTRQGGQLPGRDREPPPDDRPPLTAAEIAHGVVSAGKAIIDQAIGHNRAGEQTIRARQAICRACHDQDLGECMAATCRCWIKARTQAATERCPRGEWEAVKPGE